jgi:hypothetical protein
MNRRWELWCAWSGPVNIVLFGIAYIPFIKWLPPPSPGLTAAQVAAIYQQNTLGIRFGWMLVMYAGALNASFATVITVYMLRMKNASQALAYLQLTSGALNVIFLIMPAQIFTATAFRPDRLADITQFGNDFGWLIFDMVNSVTMLEWIPLGLAILSEESDHPIFPRWAGYFNLWGALLLIPVGLTTFFKGGPFCWNGVIGFYLGIVVFCAWYFIMFILLLRAIKAHHQAPQPILGHV